MMLAFIRSGRRVLGAGCLLATITAYGCAPTAETQQLQTSQSNIRGMVAGDRQQIEALQDKVARLDDRISELEHNGGEADNKTIGALNARLSTLESQVRGAQPAAAAPGTAGLPPGTPGAAAPAAPGAPGAPPVPGAAGAVPPPDNSSTAGDEGGDNGDANAGTNVASAAPPTAAAPPAAPPPAVSAAQSWQALLDQEADVVVLDARPFDEYRIMNIPGSINVPAFATLSALNTRFLSKGDRLGLHNQGTTSPLAGLQVSVRLAAR